MHTSCAGAIQVLLGLSSCPTRLARWSLLGLLRVAHALGAILALVFVRSLLLLPWLLGCADESLSWWVTAGDGVLQEDIVSLSSQVRRGGCEGTVLSERSDLKPGTYGFFVSASNQLCQTFAEGCVSLNLPATEVNTELLPIEPYPLCNATDCIDGRCVGVVDATVDAQLDANHDASNDASVDAQPDASTTDTAVPGNECTISTDSTTQNLWAFEDLPAQTSAERYGTAVLRFYNFARDEDPETAAETTSITHCGQGWLGSGIAAVAPEDLDKIRSLDLLYRAPSSLGTRTMMIASKGTETTNIALGFNANRRFVLDVVSGESSFRRCSEPVSFGTWNHLGINFRDSGDVELWVNGARASSTSSEPFYDESDNRRCSNTTQNVSLSAIDHDAWFFGYHVFANFFVEAHNRQAVIDQIRFSSTSRSFSK